MELIQQKMGMFHIAKKLDTFYRFLETLFFCFNLSKAKNSVPFCIIKAN